MYIKKVVLKNFKRFKNNTIELKPNVLLSVGGNNAGKSTLLHALATWEYCKTVLQIEKGQESIYETFRGNGLGVTIDDFTPLNIPSFKYLWTNLSPSSGYTLTIDCFWDIDDIERHLEIGLAFNQERLLIKKLSSNLSAGIAIPRIAYLPTFAGIVSKEQWFTVGYRNKLVGQGLAGSVIRNQIMELFLMNEKIRKEKKGERRRIKDNDLVYIRQNDPYELLNQVLFRIFHLNLYPKRFNESYHTHVQINLKKGELDDHNRFRPYSGYNERDIMVEGSGFLQWLSVYTFALSPQIDILLLDEPDAHLHCSLQKNLMQELRTIAQNKNKQIIVATHSPEVIKDFDYESILFIKEGHPAYLTNEEQKAVVLNNIGTEYFPLIDSIITNKHILFVENESDAKYLETFCNKFNVWPNNLTIWPTSAHHKERKEFFLQIKDKIPGLKSLSLQDRDNKNYNDIDADMNEKGMNDYSEPNGCEIRYRTWRRWEMESYLICTRAMARLKHTEQPDKTVDEWEAEIKQYIRDDLSLIIPLDYKQSDKTPQNGWMFDRDAKEFVHPVFERFNLNKYDVAKEMTEDEIFEDVKTIINEIINLCSV